MCCCVAFGHASKGGQARRGVWRRWGSGGWDSGDGAAADTLIQSPDPAVFPAVLLPL